MVESLAKLVKQGCIHDAHFPAEHVEKLRQSIDASTPQEITKLRCLPGGAQLSRLLPRRPKPQHLKTPAAVAYALLSFQNRPRALPFNCQRHASISGDVSARRTQ